MADRTLLRWILGKLFGFGPRLTHRVKKQQGLRTVLRDGVALVADRYYPPDIPSAPVVLMRSPYGRSALFGIMAGLLVERGFQVVLQSVRGTGGSGGQLDPMRQEQADGADTVTWIRSQPWFGNKLYTFGVSYLGNVQWALAEEVGDQVDGFGLAMTLSNFKDELLSSGGFTQGGTMGWTQLMLGMMEAVPGKRMRRPRPGQLDAVKLHLPLGTLDQVAFGKTVAWWQDWVNHDDPDDPWWDAFDHSGVVDKITAPTTMICGWQDIFLPFQLKDFKARQAAGRQAWLTIGPWMHSSPAGMIAGLRESLSLFSALSSDRIPYPERKAVRLFLQGANRWCEFDTWPPPGSKPLSMYLRSDGGLSIEPPGTGERSTDFVYDPANPTPSVHGPSAMGGAKVRNMAELEKRGDILLFTSDELAGDTDVIGEIAVDLAVISDCEHTDFFVCLCDVDKRGRSLQVADGYLRLRPGFTRPDDDGVLRVRLECWPTAYRFKRSHRLRLIVASGAHPRYARNLGFGEPLATATAMRTARQQVQHNARAMSVLHLSTVELD